LNRLLLINAEALNALLPKITAATTKSEALNLFAALVRNSEFTLNLLMNLLINAAVLNALKEKINAVTTKSEALNLIAVLENSKLTRF
jgi:hypothetical protein